MPTRLAEDTDLTALQSLLDLDEIIEPESPGYVANCQTCAAQKQCSPRLIVRPTSVESLSRTIRHLYSTKLDFAIYGHGFMSASAKDVLVNILSFDDFNFDRSSKSITLGAGQTWEQVYQKLEEEAPAYAVVGARTPAVGVAGTILNGGWSWLSGEYGCVSDPINFLDAQVAKYDGSVVYALLGARPTSSLMLSSEYSHTPRISGPARSSSPGEHLEQSIVPTADSGMMVTHAFDANGEAHGRASFKWALDLPGVIDQTRISTLADVAQLQGKVSTAKETMTQFWAPMVLPDIPKGTIIKAVEWTEDLQSIDESIAECTYLIFEVLCTRDPPGPISQVAWPRPAGSKHILLFGLGCPSDTGQDEKRVARELAIEVPGKVLGSDAEVNFLPNGFEEYHDPKKASWTSS
ncbi:hypothetical protein BDW62DRAFT_206624 [Aspergillus aurantiobrunneus]